jgi:hypothetical protein
MTLWRFLADTTFDRHLRTGKQDVAVNREVPEMGPYLIILMSMRSML